MNKYYYILDSKLLMYRGKSGLMLNVLDNEIIPKSIYMYENLLDYELLSNREKVSHLLKSGDWDDEHNAKLANMTTTVSMMKVVNIKNKHEYIVTKVIPDCTNSRDWDFIVVYTDSENNKYVRSIIEFTKKFKPL